MPYILKKDRKLLRPKLTHKALTTGGLNFQITSLIDEWISDCGLSYDVLNGAIGALECAKLELYRRIAAPYENRKKKLNGDVYSKENVT